MMQMVFMRRPNQAQLLCNSGQLPGAEAANTVEELMQACEVCQALPMLDTEAKHGCI